MMMTIIEEKKKRVKKMVGCWLLVGLFTTTNEKKKWGLAWSTDVLLYESFIWV